MIVRINGKKLDGVQSVEVVRQEFSDATAWGVVLVGALACIGWWLLWA